MCILIQHPANTNFDEVLLNDFYSHNADGFGAMYAEDGKIVVVKTLGTPAQINKIYAEELAHRDCIIHYRMKTHGDIDLDNCHPYKVTDDVWMAHNGILSFGNPIDKRKSDTWHFIEFILRPALQGNPRLIYDLDFQDYIADMIGGSNKFGFMTSEGDSIILNREAGVQHMNAWLSNTYAWSAHKYGHGVKRYAGAAAWGDYDTYDTGYTSNYSKTGVTLTPTTKHSSTSLFGWDTHEPVSWTTTEEAEDAELYNVRPKKNLNYKKVVRAAYNCYRRGGVQLLDWVITAPEKAEFLLLEWYGEQYEMEMAEIVNSDPDEAVSLISALFEDSSVSESDLAY